MFNIDDTKYIHKDGQPVRPGICVMPDHYTATFTVTVRSQRPLGEQAITDQLQKAFEVTACDKTAQTCVVSNEPA